MKQKRKASESSKTDFSFIDDPSLRKKVIDAVEIISGLYLVGRDESYSSELVKEIRRVIVLYSASIIEAVLLYLYKKKGISSTKTEYKDVHPLPSPYQVNTNSKVIIAKQVQRPKEERELMLDTLLKIFLEEGSISTKLGKKIKKAKDIRNTFHLSKSRAGLRISQKTVQKSTEAIYETIIVAREKLNSTQ